MKPALHRPAALALAAAALLALLAPARARAELLAGFAVVPLPAPLGAPLGGYGGLRDRRASGVIDPPEARALVLQSGERRAALLALDIVIVRPQLREALVRALAASELDALTVLATHTHSGPGGYVQGSLAERVTAGTFSASALQGLVQAGAQAVQRAAAELAPASAAAALAHAELARNRRFAQGARETELPLLLLRFAPGSGHAPVIAFSYGMHPTVRSAQSTRYSADYLAPARAWLEQQGARALFLPGPMGDQGPGGEADAPEDERARQLGERLAQAVYTAARTLRTTPSAQLELAERSFAPPPFALRRYCPLWWLSPFVGGAARRLISAQAPIHALALGDARLVALPAEPSSELAAAIRAGLREREPRAVPFVLAHANDWLGYALSAQAYERGGYEACLSVHGRELGPRLVDAALGALGALAPEPARSGTAAH